MPNKRSPQSSFDNGVQAAGTVASIAPNIRKIIGISIGAGMVLIIGSVLFCHYLRKGRARRALERRTEEDVGAGVNREMDRREMKTRVFGRPE